MSERKILPCPFCGGEAEVIKAHSSFPLPYTVICKTEECGASVGNYSKTREEAIAAWNTRKPVEKVIDQLEDLKCKYENIFDYCTKGRCSDYGCSNCAINDAIEIVKQGCVGTDDVCEWKYNGDEYLWETSCWNLHIFMSDGPNENKYQYCPYCGKEILARSDS